MIVLRSNRQVSSALLTASDLVSDQWLLLWPSRMQPERSATTWNHLVRLRPFVGRDPRKTAAISP
jgi:hypothetical protein